MKECKIEALALAVANGLSIKAAARVAGISQKTAERYGGSQEFKTRVVEIRQALCETGIAIIKSLIEKAAGVFAELLSDDDSRVRLKAATEVFRIGGAIPRASAEPEKVVPAVVECRPKIFPGEEVG